MSIRNHIKHLDRLHKWPGNMAALKRYMTCPVSIVKEVQEGFRNCLYIALDLRKRNRNEVLSLPSLLRLVSIYAIGKRQSYMISVIQ